MSNLLVTPLYGSHGHHPASASLSIPPSSNLLEYGGVRVLVNVGWDESYPVPDFDRLRAGDAGAGGRGTPPLRLPKVDAILLTDSTLAGLGGLPMYLGRRARAAAAAADAVAAGDGKGKGKGKGPATPDLAPIPPIYGTYPTLKMGQMTLYDHHATLCLDGRDPGFDLSDVDELFSEGVRFFPLKFSQALQLPLPPPVPAVAAASAPPPVPPLLEVTPHRAGRTTGGSFYVLRRLADETEVVVAPGGAYHHAKERHLDGATLHKFGAAADVLVTGPGGGGGALGRLCRPPRRGGRPALPGRTVARAEAELVDTVMAALRRGGNVLCPVDASGRVLELLMVLGRHWERQRLGSAYNLVWVGHMAPNTIEFARSQLEWMAAPLGAQFDAQRGHPYALRAVHICSTLAELDTVVEASNGNPTVALASGASLDSGPARDLLLRWAENQDNAVVLTDSTRCVPRGDVARLAALGEAALAAAGGVAELGDATAADTDEAAGEGGAATGTAVQPGDISAQSTSAQLLLQWCEAKEAREEMADVIDVDVPVPFRAPLAGAELQAFLAEEERARREKRAEEERRAMLREVEQAKESLRLGDDDAGGAVPSAATAVASDDKGADAKRTLAPVASRKPKKKSRFDQNLFLKYTKPNHMTFEIRDEAVGIGHAEVATSFGIAEAARKSEVLEDDYGIAIEPERFVDIVTGIDPSKHAGSGRIGEGVRGLGFGADGRPIVPIGANDDGKGGGGALEDGEAIDDEAALEAADLSEGKGIIRGRQGRHPTKVSALPRKIEVLAEVAYVPLEGRVDGRAARQMIRALQPNQVVILGGGSPNVAGAVLSKVEEDVVGEVDLLVDVIKSMSIGEEMTLPFVPSDNETVELGVGHAAYSARLIDTPYRSQAEKEADETGSEDVDIPESYEAKMGECSVCLLDNVATGQRVAADGSIVLAPSTALADARKHSVMISDGEVLLTDLRAELIAQGMRAEYSTHPGYAQLLVNGKVLVRKNQATGKIEVEGPLCQDFFSIRSVVCSQYVTL